MTNTVQIDFETLKDKLCKFNRKQKQGDMCTVIVNNIKYSECSSFNCPYVKRIDEDDLK